MRQMSSAQIVRWERIRAQGKVRFVKLRSLTGIGLWLAFCALAHFYIHLPLTISFIVFTCAFFVLGSILSAFLQWVLSDWIYVRSRPTLPWHPSCLTIHLSWSVKNLEIKLRENASSAISRGAILCG